MHSWLFEGMCPVVAGKVAHPSDHHLAQRRVHVEKERPKYRMKNSL